MTESSGGLFSTGELAALQSSFHQGSAEASTTLAKWIGKPSVVKIESLDQLPLEEATSLLSAGDGPLCFCTVELKGLLTGEMILVFDDASGLALADLLLEQSQGTATEWTEMAVSVALETTNILCCTYLSSLSRSFSKTDGADELLPSPPKFQRDFAESLLEFALMGQAVASDQVFLVRTTFEIDATPVNWTLLFVPDAVSMLRIPELIASQTGR